MKSRLAGAPPYAAIGLLAALVLAVSKNILLQANTWDPCFYTSYAQDFGDLAARYGLTYYSTRVAHIFPNWLLVHALGPIAGYVAFRWVLLAALGSAVWYWAAAEAGPAFGATGVILAMFHPWMLRSILWDHYDATIIVFLLWAVLLSARRGVGYWQMAAAGAASAMAMNCNPYAGCLGLLASAILPGDSAGAWREAIRAWVMRMIATGFGFGLLYGTLIVARFLAVPGDGLRFDRITVGILGSLLRGGGVYWHQALPELVAKGHAHLLIPPLILVAGAIVWVRRGTPQPELARALLYLAVALGIATVLDVVILMPVLSVTYYFIYLAPATFYCLLRVSASATTGISQRVLWMAASTLLAVELAMPLLLRHVSQGPSGLIWLALVALLLGLAVTRPKPGWPMMLAAYALSAAVFVAVPGNPLVSRAREGFYAGIYQADTEREWEVYHAALQLQRMVKRLPTREPMGVWYRNDRDTYLNSVESMYLWGYGRLAGSEETGGMPQLTQHFLEAQKPMRYLILLGETAGELDAGAAALQRAGISTRALMREVSAGPKAPVHSLALRKLN